MTQSDGLVFGWQMKGSSVERLERVADAEPVNKAEGCWQWLHLDLTNDKVHEWMHHDSGLTELTVTALLQAETRPRTVPADGGVMLFLRGVNHNPGADEEDMVSVRLWVSEHRVISLRFRQVRSMVEIGRMMGERDAPPNPGELVVLLTQRLNDKINHVIEDLYEDVDQLEDEVLESTSAHLRNELANVRRKAIALRRYLSPQREALNRLSTERTPVFSTEDKLHFREEYDRLTRLVEDLDAARERAGVTQEALNSNIAEQTNMRMYVLSIIAAIFLPMSFITGLLGINVGGIPGSENPLGFIVAVSIMAFMGAGLWVYLKWKRWF